MIIHDFHIGSIAILPPEAYTPLLIDPNAVLAGAIPFQQLQSIRWGNAKISKLARIVQHTEFSSSNFLNGLRQPARTLTPPDFSRLITSQVFDHDEL